MFTSSPERIEDLTRRGWWGDETLHSLLLAQAQEQPQVLAVADQPGIDAFCNLESKRLSFEELQQASVNLACSLLDHGISRDDVIVVQLPNIVELVVSYFAASMIGAIVSPLPVQYGRHELQVVIDAVSPRAYIGLESFRGSRNTEILQAAGAAGILGLTFGESNDAETPSLSVDASRQPANASQIELYLKDGAPEANDILTICWTSGTTGSPKGVPRSHNMWLATAKTSSAAGQYRTGDRLLNPFPLVNMAALGGFMFPFILNGCSLVLHHPFDPSVFLQQMQDEKITFTIVPPAVLNQLAKNPDMWNAYDFTELRRVGSGSAPLAPSMIDTFDNDYKKQIVNFYGSNEGISLFSTPETSVAPEVRATMFPRMGCADMPWSGITHEMVGTKIVRVDTEEEIVDVGMPGELLFYGPTVFDGYTGDAGDDVFTSDGWFRTGDLVEICEGESNFYRIVGRCKDIINRGGMKISPSELDILLEGYPQLGEAAVCAYADDDLGERVCVCVVPVEDAAAPELSELCAFLLDKGIAKFKLPEKLVVVAALPRNPLGKVQRHLLQQQVKNNG